MSTLLYGALERKRLAPRAQARAWRVSRQGYVPMRTVSLHLFLVRPWRCSPSCTTWSLNGHPLPMAATGDSVGETTDAVPREVIAITDTTDARILVVSLLILTPLLYLAGRVRKTSSGFEGLDLLRMLIPPLAFAAWILLAAPLLAEVVRQHSYPRKCIWNGEPSQDYRQCCGTVSGFAGCVAGIQG